MTNTVESRVKDAIHHANWFPEQEERLRDLAEEGNAAEIRAWADEIRADNPHDNEDDTYWRETANCWDRVAEAIDLNA